MDELVSVVLTTYNRPDRLSRALASVLSQSYINLEVFVVDGMCSIENEKVSHQFKDIRVIYIGLPNDNGVQAARNFGCLQCHGRFIAMLDDDDVWLPEKIERQMEIMEDDVALVLCHSETRTENDSFFERPKDELFYRDLLSSFNLSYTSVYLLRNSVLKSIGGWREDLVSMHEYDVALRIARIGLRIVTVPEVLMVKDNYNEQRKGKWGSFRIKIIEVLLFWKYYSKDFILELGVLGFILNSFKSVGLFSLFLFGYVSPNLTWKLVYCLKVWYEELMYNVT